MADGETTLRRLRPDDWALLRDVRLRSLAADPYVFGSSLSREQAWGEEDWRTRLEDPDVAVFGVFHEDVIAGMTGIAVTKGDPSGKTAHLWGSWLRPDLRGRGLSAAMYAARLAWAREHPSVEKVIVSHRASNVASMRANQKHGFTRTHAVPHVWHDGVEENEVFYALSVK